MLCFSNTNLLTHRLSHRTRVYLHWLLQVAAAICILAGLFAAVIRKYYRNKTHFRTAHAITGIVAIALTLVTVLGGIPTRYAHRWRAFVQPLHLKVAHSSMALAAYAVAVASTLCGLYSSTFVEYSHRSESVFYAMWLAILFSSQYVVYGPVANLVRRVCGMVRRRRRRSKGMRYV